MLFFDRIFYETCVESMNTTKILVTSSIFNDVTIFYDIKKKKKKKDEKKKKKKCEEQDISFFLINLGVTLTKEVYGA